MFTLSGLRRRVLRRWSVARGDLIDVSEWTALRPGPEGPYSCSVAVTPELWDVVQHLPRDAELSIPAPRRLLVVLPAARYAQRLGNPCAPFFVELPAAVGMRRELLIARTDCAPGFEPAVTIGYPFEC